MILCIAEKPSVAKDIAEVLGAKTRKDGYWEGNGYWISWTFGHLCTLKEPHDYKEQWKWWKLEDLPIIPQNFGVKVVDDNGIQKQFNCIKNLVDNCEMIINCGDAGQEGELIQRWVLLKAKCKKPVKRLWISSLTEQAIKQGFEQLKEAKEYDNLYAAGSARAIGDWLLGINATRAFTKKFGQGKATLSIGRVQTPTLAMIVQRQKEINAFTSSDYWELKTVYKEVEFNCQINRMHSEERALKGLDYLKKFELEITNFEEKEAKEGNPRLFDLTGLQVEANKKFGFSAEDTLKLVQNLYEKKWVTYPRVDTTYLSEDMHPKIPEILNGLKEYAALTQPLLQQKIPKLKSVFDNKKVTDHHAIIPTGVQNGDLAGEEKQIYGLITKRLIAVFYPECKISNSTVLAMVGTLEFKATGKKILDPGWRIVYQDEKQETDRKEEDRILPLFIIGEKGPHEPKIHKGKTTPPKHYTEATLLRAMETAGRQVEDEEMREALKSNGIGRPSTRANIIETLFRRRYIEKQKKNIVPTITGMELIDTIDDELLKSPELTGQWEYKLRLIEKGDYKADVFKSELIEMVKSVTDGVIFNNQRRITVEQSTAAKTKPTVKKQDKLTIEDLICPKCEKAKLIKGNTAIGCLNYKECGFKIPFQIFGKKLTNTQIIQLVQKKKTGIIKGLEDMNKQQTLDAKIVLNSDYQCVIEH